MKENLALQKGMSINSKRKKIFLVGILKVTDEKGKIRSRIRILIRTKMSRDPEHCLEVTYLEVRTQKSDNCIIFILADSL
jgi:hypothetical protein